MGTVERFWTKVDKNGPKQPHMSTRCWVWTASLDSNGYGKFGANERAHRQRWFMEGRTLGSAECVLHHCDNRRCVRLSHLYRGTKKHNAQDRERRGRGNHACGERNGCATHPGLRRGSKNGRAKLDEAAVVRLREEFKQGQGKVRKADLARKYNLSKTAVGHILSGKLWPHVEGG